MMKLRIITRILFLFFYILMCIDVGFIDIVPFTLSKRIIVVLLIYTVFCTLCDLFSISIEYKSSDVSGYFIHKCICFFSDLVSIICLILLFL